MSESSALPFVGVHYAKNRTPTGRRTGTLARRAANYIAYGRLPNQIHSEQQRGRWIDENGRLQPHKSVLAWSRQEAMTHDYTFTAVLSTPKEDLNAEAFGTAMIEGGKFGGWRLMVHQDTAHRHAHVLFFRDRLFKKSEFLRWQQGVQTELNHQVQQLSSKNVVPTLEQHQCQIGSDHQKRHQNDSGWGIDTWI